MKMTNGEHTIEVDNPNVVNVWERMGVVEVKETIEELPQEVTEKVAKKSRK